MKTKLVTSPDVLLFESRLNQELENLKDKKILEIKYQAFYLDSTSYVTYFTALVIYE